MAFQNCKRCRQPVQHTRTVKGQPITVDANPDPEGTVVVVPAGAMIMPPEIVERHKGVGRKYRLHECAAVEPAE